MVRQVRFLVTVEETARRRPPQGRRGEGSEAPRPEARARVARRRKRRVGRGIAAGQGKTAGRGTKGQKARAGGKIPAWFEGGQTPLHQRIPKLRGFKNPFKVEYEVVNIGDIARLVELGELESGDMPGAKASKKGTAAPITVNQEILRAAGLVRRLDRPMKVLGGGRDLSTALFVVADAFSASAASARSRPPAGPSRCSRSRAERRSGARGSSVRRPSRAASSSRRLRRPPSTAEAAPSDAATAARGARRGRRRARGRAEPRPRRRQAPPRPKPRAAEPTSRADAAATDGAGPRRAHATRRSRQTSGRVADRVRVAAQRLPRAGHPAPDPLRPRDPGRLPAAGPGAAAGHRPRRRWPSSSGTTRRSASSTCSPAAGCRSSRSSALAMNPYINASIIMQLMTGVDPVAAGAQPRGRVRAPEAQPVHPLPDRADGAAPGVRHPVRAQRARSVDHRRTSASATR